MISITLQFETLDEAQHALDRINPKPGQVPEAKVVALVPKPATVPEADRLIAEGKAITKPPKAAKEPVVEAPTPEPLAYDAVAKAITEAVKTDRAVVIAALAKFGVKKGPDLRPDQFALFLQELKA